jgi:hypothetical protein
MLFLLSFITSSQAILIFKSAFGGVRTKLCSGTIACVYIPNDFEAISPHVLKRAWLQVATHSAIFDFFPERRHALRATPHAERPLSVTQYEFVYGKKANDRQREIWKQQGHKLDLKGNLAEVTGYND